VAVLIAAGLLVVLTVESVEGTEMKLSGNRGALACCAAVALGGLLVSATSAQADEAAADGDMRATFAAAAFECPEKELCLYENSDGAGESYVVEIAWEGGYILPPEWADRASAYRNNLSTQYPTNTHYLYGQSNGSSCYTYRATLPPASQGSLPPEADNNANVVTNVLYGDEYCP
jgi:hypothetical protein